MPYQLTDFEARAKLLIKDAAGKLAAYDLGQGLAVNASIDAAIAQAAKGYSYDRPQELVTDIAGTGVFDLALPAGWNDGFSAVTMIEYPWSATAPDNLTIDDDQFLIYQSPTGKVLRLLSAVPQTGETARVHWSGLHSIPNAGNTTIPDADFDAVAALGGSLALEQLAALMVQTGDPTLLADVVDYKSKQAEYLSMAKALRAEYDRLMGMGDKEVAAGQATTQMTENLSVGLDRLTHPRRSRR